MTELIWKGSAFEQRNTEEIVTMFNLTFNSSIGHTFKFTEDVNNSNFVLIDTTMELPINIYDEATLLSPLFPILKIKGIADIEIINKYSLKIEKGSCFEWMEIAKQVVEFLDTLQNTSTESLASLTE
jgi:hypothetical protein